MWDVGWPGEQWVFSLDFDPLNPDIMYACSKNGENKGSGRTGIHGTVMKSTDGGATWFSITNGLDLNQEFFQISVDKNNPSIIYLCTQINGVFISYDAGESWGSWNEGLTTEFAGTNGNNVAHPMIQTVDGRYIYFGSSDSGVFRRKTIGSSIAEINSLSPSLASLELIKSELNWTRHFWSIPQYKLKPPSKERMFLQFKNL